MTRFARGGLMLTLAAGIVVAALAVAPARAEEPKLSEKAFEHSKTL